MRPTLEQLRLSTILLTDRHGSAPGARFCSRKRALPGGRCAAAAGIQTSLGCATEQLLPAQTEALSKLFSSSCLRPPLTSLGEQLKSDRWGLTGLGRENQTSVTWTRARELSDIPLAQQCAQRRKCCQKMFFSSDFYFADLWAENVLQIRWFRATPYRSVDVAPRAVPVHHKHWFHLTPEAADHLCQPLETKAGQDRGQTPSSGLGRCLRSCSFSHTATSGSWGAATVRDHWTQMPKLRAQHRPQWCVNTLIPTCRHTPTT